MKSINLKWFVCCCLWLPLWVNAQTSPEGSTRIEGLAPDWSNEVIRVIHLLDPISRTDTVVARDTIAADGSFVLEWQPAKKGRYFLSVRRYRAPFFADPGQHYRLAVPINPRHVLVRSWQPGEFDYVFIDLPSDDVNAHIAAFDSSYFDFYLDHMEKVGTSSLRRPLSHFIESTSAALDSGRFGPDAFMETFVTYSMAEMKLNAGWSRLDLYNHYLRGKPIEESNIAWFEFFDSFFTNYFETFDLRFGGESVANRFRMGLSPQALDSLMAADDFLHNDTLRQLVMLKSVYESFHDNRYPKKPLYATVRYVRDGAETPEIQLIANRILDRMEMGRPDYQSLLEAAGFPTIPRDTSRATVVVVSAPWSRAARKEKTIIEELLGRYGEVFQVVEFVLEGESPRTPWPAVVVDDAFEFLEDRRIYSIPTFYYLPPGEADALHDIPHPSEEELEARLYTLKAKRERGTRFKVGQ